MSEFEHLFHLLNLYGPLSRDTPEKSQAFLTSSFSLLNAWMSRASEHDKNAAWRYTCSQENHPYISLWWFTQEQKDPTRWINSWPAANFTRSVLDAHLHNGASNLILERISWALQNTEWSFFDHWDERFVRKTVRPLCRSDLDNPIMAHLLAQLPVYNARFCEIVLRQIPETYIERHTSILQTTSGGRSLVAQHLLASAFIETDHSRIVDLLTTSECDLRNTQPTEFFLSHLITFWEGHHESQKDYESRLQHISTLLTRCFPQNSNVLPALGVNRCERWRIAAHISNSNDITGFIQAKTSRMLTNLFMFPNIKDWVEFWTDAITIPGWTAQHSSAGSALYVLQHRGVIGVKISVLNAELEPHWGVFEHNAPKMGRAIAAVVSFLGGTAPQSLSDFSNLFDLSEPNLRSFPKGFAEFITAHIQNQTLSSWVDGDMECNARVRKI